MLISGFEAQVFLGIAVILGCSFIALLCDYLKGINERLREQVLELAVRKEEREALERSLRAAMVASAATANAAVAASAGASPPPANPAGNGLVRTPTATPAPAYPHAPAPAPVAAPAPAPAPPVVEPVFAAAPAPPAEPPVPVVTVEPTRLTPEPAPLEILAVEEVPPPVTLAPALELTPPEERISVPAVTPLAASDGDSNGGNVVRIRVLRTPASGASEETPAATAAPASPAPTKPDEPAPLAPYLAPATSPIAPLAPAAISEPLRLSPAATPSLPQLALSVDTPTVSPKAPEPAPAPLALPAGFTDRATLDFLKRDPAPFTGLVVSIGINDYARLAESQGKNTADDLVRNVNQLVNSLIASPNGAQSHFACRTADDEFLVIYPNETGQAAQRRLNALSERLWDFQLRSLGTFSVVFSWGATEAVSENFAEAVSAASERMLETRQNRKTISMGQPMKKVVNG